MFVRVLVVILILTLGLSVPTPSAEGNIIDDILRMVQGAMKKAPEPEAPEEIPEQPVLVTYGVGGTKEGDSTTFMKRSALSPPKDESEWDDWNEWNEW